jgi:hypothetical protein
MNLLHMLYSTPTHDILTPLHMEYRKPFYGIMNPLLHLYISLNVYQYLKKVNLNLYDDFSLISRFNQHHRGNNNLRYHIVFPKRNRTKRNQTKRNETDRNETTQNQTKRNETK